MKLGFVLLATAYVLLAQTNFVDEEVPTGQVNGINARFTLAHVPNPLSSVHVYVNRLRQRKCAACDLTAFVSQRRGVILFNACCIPPVGAVLLVDYRWATPPVLVSLAYYQQGPPNPFVEVAWADDGLSSYQVYRSSTTGGPYSLIAISPFPLSQDCGAGCYVDRSVLAGSTYFYVVKSLGLTSGELSAVLP